MTALLESVPVLAGSLGVALAGALGLRLAQPPRRGLLARVASLLPWAALVPIAVWIANPEDTTLARAALTAALAVALLAREREDRRQSEAALKLAWVMGAAFALTWAGESLLALAAGTAVTAEQWPALALQLDAYALWGAALALTLLAGLVLAGGAPFHFWVADVLHGAPAYLAPLVVAGLQSAGLALLGARLHDLAPFEAGRALVQPLLGLVTAIALVGGAATLATQRRPERRVGTLASLQGAVALAALVAGRGEGGDPPALAAWGAHLAVALTGAAALARFLPVASDAAEPPAALFRRHPLSGAAGLYALLSLAGAPGTPGMRLWLGSARELAATRHVGLLFALALAWLVAVAVAVGEARRAFGAPTPSPPPERAVPALARAALWCAALALVSLVLATLVR